MLANEGRDRHLEVSNLHLKRERLRAALFREFGPTIPGPASCHPAGSWPSASDRALRGLEQTLP